MKFIMLINIKIPTIGDISTFISLIKNTVYESLNANSLDPDQNVGPDLDPNRLTL